MATKAQVAAMLAGGDGVSVVQVGKNFQLGFLYSPTLVNKIKGVPEAKFDDEKDVWNVPGASADALLAAVKDMREFRQQDGVQLKDTPRGKLVIFDYDKSLARLIGPVDGAEFSREAGGWLVPYDSKAQVVGQGQASFLDRTINKMRGLVIETAAAYEVIQNQAAQVAKDLGYKPGIHHPQPDHSYTGQIVQANASWAAQLSGINDEKGVAFITLHKQADLGQEVFKGDNLRVDYGLNREVKVRTTEVFRQQQEEREGLKSLADGKIEGAVVLNASAKDGQAYLGRVIDTGKHFVLQHVGRNQFVLHDLEKLKGSIQAGEIMDVKYKDGKGLIAGPQLAQDRGVSR
ncbi:MAG: hypothetical protein BGO63_03970 [Candidatus Accumulibacter sp. 66-26]|nr:MAG: hypothetical protein BGO63_03970 [Candidatus Accumulibacter sp. 66-26]